MNCSDFLENYSSYRDGELGAAEQAHFQAHLGACASCSHYDLVIRDGVELVHSLNSVEPSYDFMARLQHRIYHVEDEMRLSRRISSGTSVAFVVVIAAAIGVSAWLPALRPAPSVVTLPPVVAQAPLRTEALPSLFRSGPLLSQPRSSPAAYRTDNTLFFRYTPLGASNAEAVPAVLTVQSVRQPN